ncbi:MAG: hypothetical protein R3C55_06900 [Parvularculaceae bacterium]
MKQLLPELDPPDDNASILNVHYRTCIRSRLTRRSIAFIAMVSGGRAVCSAAMS